MSTQVHFVRNNPFILNDSRFGSSGQLVAKEQISTNFGYPGYRQVSQSASCSNLQQRTQFGPPFEPRNPVPVSVFRRFRLVSERTTDEDLLINQLSKQSDVSRSAHSVAYYGQKSEDENEISTFFDSNQQLQNKHRKQESHLIIHHQPGFEKKLEHSQSHGAISQAQLREPLRIELTDKKEDFHTREGRQDFWQQKDDSPEENIYPAGVGALSVPFSNRIERLQNLKNQPVILNVIAPDYLSSVNYGTLPIKRSGSVKSAKEGTLPKSTPGANQIMKWIKEKRAKYKESKKSSASTVSVNSSSTLKPAPPQGILRTKKKDYGNFIGSLQRQVPQGRQYSAPVYPNWKSPPRTEYYDTSEIFSHESYDDPFEDYENYKESDHVRFDYFPRGNGFLPRFRSENPPRIRRCPPTLPEPDYSVSSDSEYEYGPCNSPRVRFQFPPEEPTYENTNIKPQNTKFDKIYQKLKPAVQNLISPNKKLQKEENSSISSNLSNDETDSTGSAATVHLPTKIVIEDDNFTDETDYKESGDSFENNVFFFGETRIDYKCQRVGNNVFVHYTSRKIANKDGKVASKIQRRGVITDIEYGPGIVQKLREKFSKMASAAIETAQISPHAKQKKFPSVDDILSEGERRNPPLEKKVELRDPNYNHQTQFTAFRRNHSEDIEDGHVDSVGINLTQRSAPSRPFLPSSMSEAPLEHSQGPCQPDFEEPRSVVEASPIPPISALRAKFEKQSANESGTNFHPRPSYQRRSHSVQPLIRKSASQDDVIEDRRPLQKPQPPKIPDTKPTGILPKPIAMEKERELIKMSSYHDRSYFEKEMEQGPKPVRIMDLVSPPADPAPKDYIQHHQLRSPELPSPVSSTASSDRSPPPEEPRLRFDEPDTHFKNHQDYDERINFKTQTLRDERSDEKNTFVVQKQKMTLTLPIGETYPQKSSSMSEIKVGKPGSTPVAGPEKLKIANDDTGITEVQRLLSRFTVMREQKMQNSLQTDAIKDTLTYLDELQKDEKYVPTAIVPPVQQQPKPTVVPKPPMISKSQTNWQPLQQQKNIVSITIGQGDKNDPSGSTLKHRPIPPPPLPPKTGGDQQQRRSLTSKWLENKESSSSSIEVDDGTLDKKTTNQEKDQRNTVNFGLSKPYGDNETIDEHTRRSLETMSVVKEESEEDIEEENNVRLIRQRQIGEDWKVEDSGFVHRSDFLRNSSFDNSSESDDEDYPGPHVASYGINRIGFYDPQVAADGNPIRHSLLNLVAEEDIPELLQAMAEEHHFVFDDCETMPTTSGIIHTPAKRQERKKQRNVDRICFVEKPPEVFAYLDENSANEEGEWTDGIPITFDEYKSIVESAQQEQNQQHMELAKWRMMMEQNYGQSGGDSEVERPSDRELGVTSTFVYSDDREISTGGVLQYRQTDSGNSAI